MVIFVLFLYIVKNIAYDSSRHLLSFPPCCAVALEQAPKWSKPHELSVGWVGHIAGESPLQESAHLVLFYIF